MTLRDATPADAEGVRTVHCASILGLWTETYDRDQVCAWGRGCGTADDTSAIEARLLDSVVFERDGVVVGFGSLKWEVPADDDFGVDAEVTAVYVLPSVARDGAGTEIYAELQQRAQAESVEVVGSTASLPAVPFYETHGYERISEDDHGFSSHEDTAVTGRVVRMSKDLSVPQDKH